MMAVPMDEKSAAPPAWELAQRLFKKNIELENGLRKSAQSKIPSDPNAWLQMRENYEAMILEDHDFSENHEVEYLLWQLHYRRIEEFRSHINAAASTGLQAGKNAARPDRIKKISSVFKTFLSESTGFYHDLILKIRAKYGLPLGYFGEGPENQIVPTKDEKKSTEMKKGLLSCHRCLIYLGDLARYKGLYGEGDSISRDYAAASSYYTQAASLWPSSGNPHHQLAILASYSGDDLVAIYRYFRSLAVDNPFTTARDNLIIAFEKNRQSYSQLSGNNAKVPSASALPTRATGKGRGRGDARLLAKDTKTESAPAKERELCIAEILKAFSTRFVRLNGILFTRTSLETFGEIFSSVINDLNELLSSGPEEELNFGLDVAENGLVIVRLITILIFTVHNVNRESEGQSYAEILQRSVLLQNAFIAAFEFAGHILNRCIQLRDAVSSFFLPGILVFIEWLACRLDIAAGFDVEEKQAVARSFFWNQCVAFMNKLMLSGFVPIDGNEDESCFFDMSHYDDKETGNRLALWEDFELRGFSPLAPAHLILDFSRKHSFGSAGSNKEKRARVQRILAAGRVLTNVVRVEQQGIYFDPNSKKFVIAAQPPAYKDHVPVSFSVPPESNVIKKESQVESIADLGATQSKPAVQMRSQLYVEGEDEEEEEEEIVFKPTMTDKYPNTSTSRLSSYDIVQPIQSYSTAEWAAFGGTSSAPLNSEQISVGLNASLTTAPIISKQPSQQITPSTSNWLTGQEAFISERLKNLNVVKNGLFMNNGLQGNLGAFQSNVYSHAFSSSGKLNMGNFVPNDVKMAESVVPSKMDSVMPLGPRSDAVAMNLSAALPAVSRKNPVSRPVRHFGPPPGFSHVPAKQPDELILNSVVKEQHFQIDDYSWLDGYHPSAANCIEMMNSNNHVVNPHSHVNTSNSSTFSEAMVFPFPGKQVSTVQAKAINEKLQDFQLFDQLKPYSEQLKQAVQGSLPPEQYQAQSLWSGRYV